MRKAITFALLLVSLFCSASAYGADIRAEQAVQLANQEIGGTYYLPDNINNEMWDKYEVLVYGKPQDVPASDQDLVSGQYRYLGYTPMGDLMPNPEFPPDHDATTTINNYNWIKEPWSVTALTGNSDAIWDNNPNDESYIRFALSEKYGSLFKYEPPKNAADWHQVTKILQPRTDYTPGLGRMWHLWNGSYWYITVIIPSKLPPDIEVTSITNKSPVTIGNASTATVIYKNNGPKEETFQATFYVAGEEDESETITLASGQSIEKTYEWNTPEEPGIVELKAEATPIPDELITTNNEKTTTIEAKAEEVYEAAASLPCTEASSITNDWNVKYTWTTKKHYTNSQGEPKTKTVHHSKTVNYEETLTATVAVNTKQGIAESTPESRGSWEIIPDTKSRKQTYAGKIPGLPAHKVSIYGWDPNEVTRSGYGFEVKVQTTYSNDWEDHVPSKANSKGGSYPGPDKVSAEFIDTSGRLVARTDLVPTKGAAGGNSITWELPAKNYYGTWYRKHFTDVNNKDGKYTVRVTVSGAGKTDLCLIQMKNVMIYGNMYDDSHSSVSNQAEHDKR